MQLDPGDDSWRRGAGTVRSAGSKDSGGPSVPSYQRQGSKGRKRGKGSRRRGWDMLALLLGAFLVCFFLTNLLLYERLGDAMAHAKGVHRVVARHVQKGLRTAIRASTGLSLGLHLTLPHPQLLRWHPLPSVEDVVGGEIDPPDDLELTPDLEPGELPQYLREPSLELRAPTTMGADKPAKKDPKKQKPAGKGGAPVVEPLPGPKATPSPEKSTGESGPGADQPPPTRTDQHSFAPILSSSVLDAIDIHQRLQPLLDEEVGTVLTGLLLEMKGTISCGGHLIMEFNNFEEMVESSPEVSKVVPDEDPLSNKWGTCAVVGNSGTLLSHVHGKEIDKHDTVIRFNKAPTRDYEQHVGTKTTIRMQNVDNLGYREKASEKYLIFSARSKKDLAGFVRHRKSHPTHPQYAFNPEFWCHVWNWVSHRKLKPTSGMAGVVMALRHCTHPVDIYGFSHNSTRFHYFNELAEKVTTKEIYRYHPLVEEAELYRELEELNMVRVVK